MKTHKVLFLALLVSASLAVSVEAGDRRGNNGRSQVAPARGRSSVQSFSSGSGYRYGGGRMIGSSPRFSSLGVGPIPSQRFAPRSGYSSGGNVGFSQRQFTSRTFSNGNGFARFQNNGNFGTIQNNRVNHFSSLGNSNGNFNRTGGSRFSNNNRGFTGAGNHVFSRRSADWHRDWDRRSDHWWNGNRCRFVDGSWLIF